MNTHTDSIDLQKYKHIYFIGIGEQYVLSGNDPQAPRLFGLRL